MKGLFWMVPLVFLSGCVSPPERQPVPERADVPGAWSAAGDTNGVVFTWWNSFGSTQVVDLVTLALTNNLDLQSALARMESAAADARIAGADLYPTVNGGLDARRTKQNFIGFPIPGGGDEPLSTTYNSFGLNLSATWELDLWGRIRSGQKAVIADVQASQADFQALQQSIAAQTVKTWLLAVELKRQIEFNERIIGSFSNTVRQVERRYQRGIADSVEYRLALTDLEGGLAALAERRSAYARATRQLDFILGRYPDGLLDVQLDFPALQKAIPVGLPSELLSRRPDVIAAERRLAASVYRIKEARRALLPRISLTAGGGTSSDDLSDLTNPDFSIWSIAANAAQPIFQGGRLLAGIDLSKSRNRQALADYSQAILQAFTEVESALAVEQDLADRERHLTEAVSQARGSLTRAEERYASGLESVLAVLQAQRNTFNFESALINVQRVRLDNRVDLHLALGGGVPFEISPPIPPTDSAVTLSKAP